jgi:ABC-type cobalamin/Fe3+-siderophores transport system ATPase subunit
MKDFQQFRLETSAKVAQYLIDNHSGDWTARPLLALSAAMDILAYEHECDEEVSVARLVELLRFSSFVAFSRNMKEDATETINSYLQDLPGYYNDTSLKNLSEARRQHGFIVHCLYMALRSINLPDGLPTSGSTPVNEPHCAM